MPERAAATADTPDAGAAGHRRRPRPTRRPGLATGPDDPAGGDAQQVNVPHDRPRCEQGPGSDR
ncbi:hypothetical protein DMP17_29660 [Pseudonocardia sp. TMWB2A]